MTGCQSMRKIQHGNQRRAPAYDTGCPATCRAYVAQGANSGMGSPLIRSILSGHGQGLLVHVELDGTAAVAAEAAPGLVSGEDGALPVRCAMSADFKVGDHAADRVEKLVVEAPHTVEVVVACRVGEHERRDSFLDRDRPPAVLSFVDFWAATPFAAEQGAHDGGPAEARDICGGVDVVEAVTRSDLGASCHALTPP